MTREPATRDDPPESGFSLIEVLVVACLLAGAMTGVAHVFVIAARATVDAERATYATVLAAQKMEELRATPLSAVVTESFDYADVRGALVIEGAGSPRAAYERRWSVEPLPGAPDLLAVTVTVIHRHSPPPAGRARLITLRAARRPAAEAVEGAPDE